MKDSINNPIRPNADQVQTILTVGNVNHTASYYLYNNGQIWRHAPNLIKSHFCGLLRKKQSFCDTVNVLEKRANLARPERGNP